MSVWRMTAASALAGAAALISIATGGAAASDAAVGRPAGVLAARGPGDPKESLRKQDEAWAKRIVVNRSELPSGVTWRAYDVGGPGDAGGGGSSGCPGVRANDADLTVTGSAASLYLDTRRVYSIESMVWILASAGQAEKFSGRQVALMARCVGPFVKQEARTEKGVRFLSFTRRHVPGTSPAWTEFRLALSVPDQGRRIKSFVDLVFGRGSAAAASLVLHAAFAPIPAGIERGLVNLMDERMAHR